MSEINYNPEITSFKQANLYLDTSMLLNFIHPDSTLEETRFISIDLVFSLIKDYFKGGVTLSPGDQ
jgi:hypothetical protein